MLACDDPEFMFVLNNSNSSDVWPAINIKKSKTWVWENGFFYKNATYTFMRTWTLALSIQVKKECWAWPLTCSLEMTEMRDSLGLASCHPTPCLVRHSSSSEQGEEQQNRSLDVLLWPPYNDTHILTSISISCLCLSRFVSVPFSACLCLSVPVSTCLCLSLPVYVSLSLPPQDPPWKNSKVYF